MSEFKTLESIFHMITPADLIGAKKLALGKGAPTDVNKLQELIKIIFGSSGAQNVDQISTSLTSFAATKADKDEIKQFMRIINFYKTGEPCKAFGDAPFMAMGKDGEVPVNKVTFDQIVGPDVKLDDAEKSMGIMLCNSGFLSPAFRNTERVELFMNFLPSIIASRMVPLLDVEFVLNRSAPEQSSTQQRAWAPSLMKFLLGGDASQVGGSATEKMLALREVNDKDQGKLHAIAGMEMFTSPQTLVNQSKAANAGRYVDVLDPSRPFMTIESFTVNVAPNVGLYSYKKATLVFKLHDRSRLSEISDLVRPQVYQDKGSAPTIWVTYGWRHPPEPGNHYAEFINNNMLVREAYGIINSQFAFDQVGQVTVTLNLSTTGLTDMRTKHINDDGSLEVVQSFRALAKEITNYRNALGIGSDSGLSREIRGFQLLEAASNATYPDTKENDISKDLTSLIKGLRSPEAKLDKPLLDKLIKSLEKIYKPGNGNNEHLNFKTQLESQATAITQARFNEIATGLDPFLPFTEKVEKTTVESEKEPSPLTQIVASLNAFNGETKVQTQSNSLFAKSGFKKKAVSFGKVFSVFAANTFKDMDSVEEMQLFFYQFNDKAGLASGINIAEFLIEMPILLDRYKEHIERKGADRVTLEEFLQLVIDSQLHDIRAISYGFRKYYAPYDSKNKDPALRKSVNPDQVELAKQEFLMPVINLYVETVYSSDSGNSDRLKQYEKTAVQVGTINGGRSNQYKRIMRIHIFDKNNNPHKLADRLLRAENDLTFKEVDSALVKQLVSQGNSLSEIAKALGINNVDAEGRITRESADASGKGFNNQAIKNFVSKTIPTIVYGGNASSVIGATLASTQDPLLATAQMQQMSKGSGRPQTLQTNGSDVGGLPLRIIPASMSMSTLGCPLLTYAQLFFIDFNTGTTADNIYNLTGLTHTISAGKFETQLTLTFADAYGRFYGASTLADMVAKLQVPETKKK